MLGIFVWHLVTHSYIPVSGLAFGDANTEAAVRAVNAGYPYRLLYPATGETAELLRPMNEGVIDQGIEILIVGASRVRDWFTGTHVLVTPSWGWRILLMLFVLTAAAIVAPGVPLPTAIAGLLAFQALVEWGPVGFGEPVHWGVAYGALIVAVYLGTVLEPWTKLRFATLSLLALLGALAGLLRQEAGGVVYLTSAALLASAAVIGLLLPRLPADMSLRLDIRALVRRAIVGGILLSAVAAAAMPIERWCIARGMGTAYADTPAVAHGSGWPLYLSLGYVSNPFNIAWRDPVGQVHAALINSGPVVGSGQLHSVLLHEYFAIVVSRPWLLLENIAARAARIHALVMRQSSPFHDVAVWQQPAHVRLYLALPWVMALCVGVVWWRGTLDAAVLWVASVVLGLAASAGALLVYPDYIGGVQGAIVILTLVTPVAVAFSIGGVRLAPSSRVYFTRRFLIACAALASAALAAASIVVAAQWARYRRAAEQTERQDPVEALVSQQFRYAHVFNDLAVARQGRLVARLTASNDSRVARVVDSPRGDLDLFRPIALVRTAAQLHLLAWMGDSFRPPVPSFYQGRTDTLFFICGECPPASTVNDYPFDSGWTFINDLEWRGRYRIFSVPLNSRLHAARFFYVAAERVVALDPSVQSTGLRPGLIASARVSYWPLIN